MSPGRTQSPIRFFGSSENAPPTPFVPQDIPNATPSPTQKGGPIFTYVNPFEQLAASSPRNAKPRTATNGDAYKRKIKSPSPAISHTASRRKLTPSSSEVLHSIESTAPKHLDDGRSQIEALMGIGAPSRDAETVAEALNEVGDKVNQQVEDALAEAEGKQKKARANKHEPENAASLTAMEETIHDAAVEVKNELDKEENQTVLKDVLPAPVAEAVKDAIDEAAQVKAGDSWESADGEDASARASGNRNVQVYQFPLRPFVSIDIVQKDFSNLTVREDSIVNIARFKKDFDQLDRILATATNDFIVYGMPKNGGVRVIQQENGISSLVFPNTQDRIFNVVISTGPSSSVDRGFQRVIATGISGAVYWTTIGEPDSELSQTDMETQTVVFPPVPTGSDSTSSGQLKTRAKKSSRHPEFFAIGRGKSIQIVFPTHARNSELLGEKSTLDTENYFEERSLKISTGKAGKDFTFSEDDSTIATLDKAGKLKIWDIRELTVDDNAVASKLAPIELRNPLITYATAHSTEKSWPTSVLFVDKARAYTKGTAFRYIIVGMKQNHTLQLWDLCLSKAVQELSFPHQKETDAICSVTYHPGSGIIAVGHPTRNSIYFIHLSAPKYNLPNMQQAKFVQRLVNKDSSLPRAEATAIMSGMREYSFANKGQLRSIELVPATSDAMKNDDEQEDPVLFELYVMHSKGVTCLGVKKEDLGWSSGSKVTNPVDAEKEGLIVVRELRESSTPSASEPSANSVSGEHMAITSKSASRASVKEPEKAERVENGLTTRTVGEKDEKKRSKHNEGTDATSRASAASSTPLSHGNAEQRNSSPAPEASPSTAKETGRPNIAKHASRDAPEPLLSSSADRAPRAMANGDSISLGISGDFLDKELKKIETGVSSEFNRVISRELDTLYRKIADEKRIQDAAGVAKQEAVLRLVSSQLGENVENALSRIIMKNIQGMVLPSIAEVTTAALEKQLGHIIGQQLKNLLPSTVKDSLSDAVARSMQTPDLLRALSLQVTKSISGHVEKEFQTVLNTSIVPAFTKLAVNAAQKVASETERRVQDQLQRADIRHREDGVKIDQLMSTVGQISQMVEAMGSAQSDFQREILALQLKAGQDDPALARRESLTPSESASMQVSPEQVELETMTTMMQEGRFEEATVMVCMGTCEGSNFADFEA